MCVVASGDIRKITTKIRNVNPLNRGDMKLTIVLTISSPQGIVMAADRKITRIENGTIEDLGVRDKLIILDEHQIAVAYWGLATLNRVRITDHIDSIRASMLDSGEQITVNTFAEEMMEYFQQFSPPTSMGFHIAGYLDNNPQIRHVFHVDWHGLNEFTNEDSNVESHNQGIRRPHTRSEDYIPYLSLFNGDNTIIQSLLLSIPAFHGSPYTLDYERFSLAETEELVKLLTSLTIYLPRFLRGYRRVGRPCGNGLDIVKITSSNIQSSRNIQTIEFSLL